MKFLAKTQLLLVLYYFFIFSWWLILFFSGIKDSPTNLAFAFAYGLIPLFGGFFGLLKAKKWGLFKSAMGKALFFLSVGLLTWSFGEIIWSYYNFVLQIEIPYPSWADASFIVSWPLWTIGVYYLSFATGAKFGLKNKSGQLLVFFIPIIAIMLSYYLLVTVARQGSFTLEGGLLKVFFDLAYPVWDVIILTLALLIYGLSFKYLGGRFRWPVLIVFLGFVINYIADFGFSYTTTIETFYNGSWVDFLFALAMFTLSFGVNSFDIKES